MKGMNSDRKRQREKSLKEPLILGNGDRPPLKKKKYEKKQKKKKKIKNKEYGYPAKLADPY